MKRTWIRILAFGGAALLALQVLPWRPAAAVFPSLSPVLSLLGALAARTATLSMLLGLPILILAWFHSRWFCRWLCPVGLAAETAGRLHPAARRRFAEIHPLMWLIAALFVVYFALEPVKEVLGLV